MRHAIGIVLAVAMSAAVFFGASWGYLRVLRLPVPGGSLTGLPANGGSLISDHHLVLGLAALAGAGLLAGLLVAIRWVSPLAAGLPGLVLLAWTGLYLDDAHTAVRLVPLRTGSFGSGFETLGMNGILAVLGFVMVVPLFIPSRWRTAGIGPAVDEADDEAGTTLIGNWS
jgi:hypothetical protein